MEAASKMMMEFSRKVKRRGAAQQAIESVLERVGYFNDVEVQNFLKSYNIEMASRSVNESMRLEYFCRVVSEMIYEEMKELQVAHNSWGSFQETLGEACSLYEFNQWVSSLKTHQSVMHAFIEFESLFAKLSEWDQRLVGVNKVLVFVNSINLKERKAIGIRLEDDDGANGLTEDWMKVEREC